MPQIREIALIGHPVLQTHAARVKDFSDPQLPKLIEDMIATMENSDGIGIAATQIYESVQVFIMASRPTPRYPDAPNMEPEAIFNPEITWKSPTMEKDWEGCLSVPGIRGLVQRHSNIGVRYQQNNGEYKETLLGGFVARIFQHEYDHLHSMTFLERVENNREIVSEKEFFRIISDEQHLSSTPANPLLP